MSLYEIMCNMVLILTLSSALETSGFRSSLPKDGFRALFLFLLAGVALFKTSSLRCELVFIAWSGESFAYGHKVAMESPGEWSR